MEITKNTTINEWVKNLREEYELLEAEEVETTKQRDELTDELRSLRAKKKRVKSQIKSIEEQINLDSEPDNTDNENHAY